MLMWDLIDENSSLDLNNVTRWGKDFVKFYVIFPMDDKTIVRSTGKFQLIEIV